MAELKGFTRMNMRLAIRSEGGMVNAYLAANDSMAGAELLASVRRSLIEQDPEFFGRWKALVRDMFARMVEDTIGVRPAFGEEPAPEHERSGRA